MVLDIPKEIISVVKKLQDKNYDCFIVGGAVRDLLTNRQVYDWDFTTNATPEQIQKVFEEGIYDNNFGTVMLPNNLTTSPFDITTYRTEHGYSDFRKPDSVSWGKSLEEDLKRRDFTINAMALKFNFSDNLREKSWRIELIDPYQGVSDLDKKIIRAVGAANERFSEDALRMLRAVRIASELNFSIQADTLSAIQKNSELIKKISSERVRDELLKILKSNFPYQGVLILKNVGLMEEIFPELIKCFSVEQKSPGRHHIYDVGTHSLYSLKFVAEKNQDPIVRLATLLHDVGKASTYKKLDSGVITFYNHEIVGGKIIINIAQRLRLSKKDSEKLFKLVRYHQFTVSEKQTDSAIRRFIRNVGLENVSDMLDLRVGDRLGGGATETSWRLEEFKKRLIEVQKQPFSVTDLKIDGNDVLEILNLKQGPEVGKILGALFKLVENKKLDNSRRALIAKLEKLKISNN